MINMISRPLPWLGIGFLFLLPIAYLIVSILISIWVYYDARDRGEQAAIWLLIVLVANFVGLIIWLIVRPPKQGQTEINIRG